MKLRLALRRRGQVAFGDCIITMRGCFERELRDHEGFC